jgi:curved DNA-binding protein
MTSDTAISLTTARAVLGVGPLASPGEIRRAFREAAKQAHPDRPGGDERRFRLVMAAYHRLQARRPPADRIIQPPAPVRPKASLLAIDPLTALRGGVLEHTLADSRRVRLTLPAGLRSGDRVRVGETELPVVLRGGPDILVRGDDLWISAEVPAQALAEGGRVALETPIGRRVVWLTRRAGERRLIRIPGQGLPARGTRPQGCLFVRLSPAPGQVDSAARALLRRFAAAWAA